MLKGTRLHTAPAPLRPARSGSDSSSDDCGASPGAVSTSGAGGDWAVSGAVGGGGGRSYKLDAARYLNLALKQRSLAGGVLEASSLAAAASLSAATSSGPQPLPQAMLAAQSP